MTKKDLVRNRSRSRSRSRCRRNSRNCWLLCSATSAPPRAATTAAKIEHNINFNSKLLRKIMKINIDWSALDFTANCIAHRTQSHTHPHVCVKSTESSETRRKRREKEKKTEKLSTRKERKSICFFTCCCWRWLLILYSFILKTKRLYGIKNKTWRKNEWRNCWEMIGTLFFKLSFCSRSLSLSTVYSNRMCPFFSYKKVLFLVTKKILIFFFFSCLFWNY